MYSFFFSDNIDYGIEFARKFIDAPEQLQPYKQHDNKLKHRIQMNLHNNEAGREVTQRAFRIMYLISNPLSIHGFS